MKKFFTYIVLPMLAVGALAQSVVTGTRVPTGKSWEDKHFREALERGRQAKSYYELINADKKVIKLEDLTEFCQSHGYLWSKDYTTKEIPKFGDVATSIHRFYFLPKEEWVYYVFEWTDRTMSRSSDLRNKGSVYFFDAASNSFICLRDNAMWTGSVSDGFVEGNGAGIWTRDGRNYYYFSGNFRKGFPVGKAKFRVVDSQSSGAWGYSPRETLPSGRAGDGSAFREVELGEMQDGMALFRYLDNGEKRKEGSELWGYVSQSGAIAIKPIYKTAHAFSNGRAAVVNDKGEDVYIDKTGQFVDYTAKQKQIIAEAKAKEAAEKAEQERQRLLAEQKAAEEQRKAEAKEADLKRRIEANKNTRLWSRGCRLAYRYPNGYEYVLATLEEWNEDRSKVKVKIVASPSATRSLYNGDLLEKNNTTWVAARGEGWHLALEEEIAEALANDNSVKRNTTTVINTGPTTHSCSACNGTGRKICYSCGGTGRTQKDSWDESKGYETCYTCRGTTTVACSSCDGTGRR